MKAAKWEKILLGGLVIVGGVLVLWWMQGTKETVALRERVPGTDRTGVSGAATQDVMEFQGELVTGKGQAADLPGAWPRFRGVNRDGVSRDETVLARKWAAGGPSRLWSMKVGEGYAGAAIREGRVYLLDYDQEKQADALRCLSLGDGAEIWRYSYSVDVKRNHGMSRTVPAVSEKYVVSLGPKCHVVCLDAMSGEFKWAINLPREYQTKVPPWYAGQCPLIDRDRAIIAPGGEALMIAVDCETGKVVWKTPNPMRWEMTHSSIVPMRFGGREMYVYCGSGGVAGISAENGEVLWQTNEWRVKIANVPSPVVLEDGRIFLSGGYDAGSMMIRLREEGGKLRAEKVFELKPTVFGAEQQTPIYYKGNIYGVIPGGQLVCLDLEGKVRWSSGGGNRYGIGPYMIADGIIYLMSDTGTMTMVEATGEKFNRLDEAVIFEHGHEAWGPMALAGGRLIVRDMTRMVCLEVK